ncbi:AI-2E family transporter [Patescibacteria group bacterium]|nr:AI-2E family transporter [Patescibacteria group bacterium]
MTKNFTKSFLIILVVAVLIAAYLIFRPFLTEIFVAAILVSVFYKPFELLTKFLKGRRNLAAILMCLILVLIIIIPSAKLISYAGQKSVDVYTATATFFENNKPGDIFQKEVFTTGALSFLKLDNLSLGNEAFQGTILEVSKKISNLFISGATVVFKETTKFVVSLALIIMTMFFFFVDGASILKRLMYLSPLSNKHDRIIFNKFRKVSYTIFVSTFVAAGAQGLIAALGFGIVGFPPLLAGVLVALLSLLPYVGSMIFYVPVGIFYLLSGDIWQGIFLLAWGFIIIGATDNIIRAYMIRGDAEVNPVFVLFAILGGLSLFGFWGIVLGPLIIALMVTIFHIYELEFCEALDGGDCETLEKESKILLTKKDGFLDKALKKKLKK